MSFLVALNGQFSPLTITSERVTKVVTTIPGVNRAADTLEFHQVLHEEVSTHSQTPHMKIEAYEQNNKKFEQDKKREHARDIMSAPVKVLSLKAQATEARSLLQTHGLRHIPVVDERNIIVGIISDREVAIDIERKTCAEIMIKKVIVCDEMTSINEIAIILLREKINALPVLNHKHELTGIITLTDILNYVIKSTAFLGRA